MSSTVPEREAYDVKHTKGTPLLRTTATTANGLKVTIPTEWYGRLVEFTSLGSNAAIRFGDAAGTLQVDMTTESAGTPPAITAGGKEPHLVVPNGATKCERIPVSGSKLPDGSTVINGFAHIADAAGHLYMCLASGDGT